MSWTKNLHIHFQNCCDYLFKNLNAHEVLSVSLDAEDSIFIRFNQSRVRQNTSVQQTFLTLDFQSMQKSYQMSLALQLSSKDFDILKAAIENMRQIAQQMPADPHQVAFTNHGKSYTQIDGSYELSVILKNITDSCSDVDLAGLLCLGPVVKANRNSLGQDHWFENHHFFFDYSIYNGPRAVKDLYADQVWNSTKWLNQLKQNQFHLQQLNKPQQKILPGTYRAYLAPAAVSEVLQILSWGALSYHNYKTGTCAFKKLVEKEQRLSQIFTLKENFNLGWSPPFNSLGEVPDKELILIKNGELSQFLISSKSAQEFSVRPNAAEGGEYLRAPEILPGSLREEDILKKLDTGLYLSQLHYLNWSDEPSGRFTGMTRFACFWVEKGQIQGPIQDMRFDEHLIRIFGENLLEITSFQHIEPDVGTYYQRAVGAKKIPGILLQEFNLTL